MSVVVYYGDDDYCLEDAVNRLRTETVDPAMASLSHRVFKKPSLATVLEAAGTMSLALGGKTLIEFQDFHLLSESPKDGEDKQMDELKALLESQDVSKVLLFRSTKIDVRMKFPKWLTKHADFKVHKFERLNFWEVEKAAQFIYGYVERNGGKIARDAADYLAEAVGVDLRLLTNEADKLMLYKPQSLITLEDVKRMAPQSDNMFNIINRWICKEDPAINFADLHETLLKRHPVELFAMTQTYFNNIFKSRYFHSQGNSPDSIAAKTGQKPFTVRKHLSQFGHIPMSRFYMLKKKLVEIEWKAKTGQLQGPLSLEMLLGS